MSISAEYAQEHRKDPAVLCCRTEAGTVLTEHNLEDPAIFDDLVESGLLNLAGALAIGQVMGATLTKTADSLTPISAEMVEGANAADEEKEEMAVQTEEKTVATAAPAAKKSGVLKLHIDEGKGIDIELPMGYVSPEDSFAATVLPDAAETAEAAEEHKDFVRRELKNYTFPVKEVKLGDKTSFENGVLTVRESLVPEALACNDLVTAVHMDIISPDKQDVYVNTMMDIQPIAVKKEGELGIGTTFEMTGVYMLLTGTD